MSDNTRNIIAENVDDGYLAAEAAAVRIVDFQSQLPEEHKAAYSLKAFCGDFNNVESDNFQPNKYTWNNELSDTDNIRSCILANESSFLSSWLADLRLEGVMSYEKSAELLGLGQNIRDFQATHAVREKEIAVAKNIEADLKLNEYTEVDDYLDTVLEAAEEQHNTEPSVSDDYLSDNLLFPYDISGEDLYTSVKEIKCDSFEWLPPEVAVAKMNAENDVSANRVEQLNVNCISEDGKASCKDISPEAFYVLHKRTSEHKEQLREAVQKLTARKEAILNDAVDRIDDFKAMAEKEPEKLLPLLNTVCNRNIEKLQQLNEKNAARVDKVHIQENKIIRCQCKAERLENTNKMLTSLFGQSKLLAAPLQAIVKRNEKSVEKLRTERIPRREKKIAGLLQKIDKVSLKIDKRQCKVDKLQNVSKAIKSFRIIGNADRRREFSEAIGGLNAATIKGEIIKVRKLDTRLEALNGKYEEASIADKLAIAVAIKELTGKKHALAEKISKLTASQKPFTERTDTEIDKALAAASAECAGFAEADISSLPDKINEAVLSEMPEKELAQKAVKTEITAEQQLANELDKSTEILSELKSPPTKDSVETNAPVQNKNLGDRPNIIGNEKYENIQDKFFVKMSAEKAAEVSAVLKQNDIKFSGRIYENQEATITLDRADLKKYRELTSDKLRGHSPLANEKSKTQYTSLSDIKSIDKQVKATEQKAVPDKVQQKGQEI